MHKRALTQIAVEIPDASVGEFDLTGSRGKERIVPAAHHVGAGVPFSAALADQNVARLGPLAFKEFDAQAFRL